MTFDEFVKKVKERVPRASYHTTGKDHWARFGGAVATNALSSETIWVKWGSSSSGVSSIYGGQHAAKWPD